MLWKKNNFLFPLSSRRQLLSCATFSTFSPEFTTWVSCPARRTWKEELEPEQDWYNHPQCEHLWETWLQRVFAVEKRKGHDSFQIIPFRMSSAVPYKCPPPSTSSKSSDWLCLKWKEVNLTTACCGTHQTSQGWRWGMGCGTNTRAAPPWRSSSRAGGALRISASLSCC